MGRVTGPDSHPNAKEPGALDPSLVLRVARLARLAMTPEAAAYHARRLAGVLEHARTLERLELSDVEPMAYPGDTANVWREDAPGPALAHDTALRLAPEVDPPFLKVPKVIGGGDGA